jgi:glycerol-3-phosphate acyltransferase PlsX
MGGDHAPAAPVAGALDAVRGDPGIVVDLVGRRADLEAEVASQGGAPANLKVVHADEVVEMADSPVEALRRRPEASILKALQRLAGGESDAFVSAGSTGAVVAASMMVLGRLPGVRRPGIAVPVPARNTHGVCLLIDAGANPNCRPHHLFQYGVMGANYYAKIFGEENPRVALLSIGEEEGKGNTLTRDAAKILRKSPIRFTGNVEGRDLFGGACEVAVTDGFVGNIILKTSEGAAEMVFGMFAEALASRSPEVLQKVMGQIDYAEWGGAPLLGVNGVVVIAHGRSDRRAIANAIRVAARAVNQQLNDTIVRGLSRAGAGAGP